MDNVRPVHEELLRRVMASQEEYVPDHSRHTIAFAGNIHLKVKIWNEILDNLRIHLVQDNAQGLIPDINHIIGLCIRIYNTAFLPLKDEDLSPGHARRINSFWN